MPSKSPRLVSYAVFDGNLVTGQNPGPAKETSKGAVVTPASEWYIFQLALKSLPPSGAIQFMAKVADVQQMAPRGHFIDSPQEDRRLFLNNYGVHFLGSGPESPSIWLFFTRKHDGYDFIHVIPPYRAWAWTLIKFHRCKSCWRFSALNPTPEYPHPPARARSILANYLNLPGIPLSTICVLGSHVVVVKLGEVYCRTNQNRSQVRVYVQRTSNGTLPDSHPPLRSTLAFLFLPVGDQVLDVALCLSSQRRFS